MTALEDPKRGSVVYLRWWENGNWRHQSLGESCRTASGRLIKAVCDRATAEALARSRSRSAPPPAPSLTTTAFSIASASELVFHPDTGRWKKTTSHGKEIARALELAATHWAGRDWQSLTRGDWRGLWRARSSALRNAGHNGFRGTELVIAAAVLLSRRSA